MNNEANKYTGSKSFKDVDEFKAPNLEFNCDSKPYIRQFFKELLPVDEKFEKDWEEKIKNPI